MRARIKYPVFLCMLASRCGALGKSSQSNL
jgi:hypothetical protein